MNTSQQQAVERVARLDRAVANQALSGAVLKTASGKEALASLLVQATSPDFDPAVARQSIIEAMGLSKGAGR